MRFTVLGTVAIVDADERHTVARAQTRGLLALLVLNAGRALSQAAVVEALWGGAAPSTARNQVQTAVHAIRRKLAELSAAESVVGGPAGYKLVAEPDQIDAVVFESLVRQAQATATDDPAAATRLLREGLALWHGEPLAGATGAFVPSARARLTDRRLAAVEALADLELRLGRPAAVADDLPSLVDTYPLREGLRARLMTALYRTGRQVEALDVYRGYRQLLAEREGLDPSPELAELEVAILRRDPRLAAGGTPAQPPATERPAERPDRADRTGPPTPAQLPADVPDFTGRAAHLRALDRRLPDQADSGAPAVVVIAGAAGVGKTALAVHWAHRVRDRFPDGQLYVNLAGYATMPPLRPIDALARFLRGMAVPDELIPVEVDEAAGMLRSVLAGRRMLLLLDNARDADQVRPLLPGTAGCLALVTSRDDLIGLAAKEGARRVGLDVLDPDEAGTLLGRLLGADRVAAEPEASAELAGLCGYLPLALRVAAANLQSLSGQRVADYAGKLRTGDRLAALAVDGDDTVAVRGAFELSYVDLPVPARRMFRLLGLAPGVDNTASSAAALAVERPETAARLLRRLADAHLIDEPTPGRYQFHDLLRLYAGERAAVEESEPERAAAVLRLYDHYLSTVDAAARVLYPQVIRLELPEGLPAAAFDDPAPASAWLDVERANLVAAIGYAAEHGPVDRAWLLADALRGYFQLSMRTVEWLVAAQTALAAAESAGARRGGAGSERLDNLSARPLRGGVGSERLDNLSARPLRGGAGSERLDNLSARPLRGLAAAHLSLAALHLRQGRHAESIDHHTRALTEARRAGWTEAEAAALGNLGAVYNMAGRLTEAAEQYVQALALNRRLGNFGGQAVNLGNLGGIYSDLGRLAEATEHHGQALELYRKAGSRSGEALALANLGETTHGMGRLAEGLRYSEESVTLRREVGDRAGEAETLIRAAVMYCDAGRPAEARQCVETALALARDIGHPRIAASATHTFGIIYLRLGDAGRAAEHHRAALADIDDVDERFAGAEALIGLAQAERVLGDLAAAERTAERALAIALKLGYRVLAGQARTVLGAIAFDRGDLDRAGELAERALAGHDETGHRLGAAHTHVLLGRVRRAAGDGQAARRHWYVALALYEDIGTADASTARELLTSVV